MSRVSITEVAKIAGVSVASISRYINHPEKVAKGTRLKVQEAIRETGYTPNDLARSLRHGRTNTIMVVVPSVGIPFFGEVMNGIRRAAQLKGYAILIYESQYGELTADEVTKITVSKQTDGIILLASISPFGTQVLSQKDKHALPTIIACETISSELSGFPSVCIDNVRAAMDATHYLISMGHKKIAFISGPESSLITKDREAGFHAAMHEAELPVEEEWLADGALSIDGAITATRALLGCQNPPTAIFCGNDDMAIGCLHAVKTSGFKVPEDISVMGFDDIAYTKVTDPPLTTIAQPAAEIGERVMLRLCKVIEHENSTDSSQEIVPHEIIIRQSVGRAP